MKQLTFLFILLSQVALWAQQTPADPQTSPFVIKGGTIHIGDETVIENGVILVAGGKIQEITTLNRATDLDIGAYQQIDATGMDIYPGLIAPNTQLGLTEINAVRATNDARELGYLNPSMRTIIAYNTDSRVTPTVRSNGILLAQISPRGGRISGQSSVVELDAWNWEDAAYKTDEGIYLNFPSLFSWSGWQTGHPAYKKNKKYSEQVQEVDDFLKIAKAYAQKSTHAKTNLKFEAMRGLFDGTKQLYIRTDLAKPIMEAVVLCQKYHITPVIVGGYEAWQIADFLAENKVPVLLHDIQSLPQNEHDAIDQPFKNPLLLSEKGVLFGFGLNGAWQQRNLPFQAGQAVAFGLDYEKAIAALTGNTAKILGIDETVGTLQEGKDATLIISEGDVLDMRTNKVKYAFIRGKAIDLDNKQKALYRKFMKKYDTKK